MLQAWLVYALAWAISTVILYRALVRFPWGPWLLSLVALLAIIPAPVSLATDAYSAPAVGTLVFSIAFEWELAAVIFQIIFQWMILFFFVSGVAYLAHRLRVKPAWTQYLFPARQRH
ncbi:MAG: hypothetical protein ACR2PW_06745 [Gammaproteobacteria bacterium]